MSDQRMLDNYSFENPVDEDGYLLCQNDHCPHILGQRDLFCNTVTGYCLDQQTIGKVKKSDLGT